MRKQVIEAARWTRDQRKCLGWSLDELAIQVSNMADDFRWEGETPGLTELRQLEREEPNRLPRWFKLVRYAVERAYVDNADALRWLAERNYFFSTEPLKLARPWLFEDEYRFINVLELLGEDRRRALRAFVTNFATRQCYQQKEDFARVLLDKFGITATVLDDRSRELVERFEKLKPGQRDMILEMMRAIV